MTTPQDEQDGAFLHLMGELDVSLKGLGAQMKRMNDEADRRALINRNIMPLSLELIPVAASTVVDQPNTMGPRTGWYWDIETVICQAMAGSNSQIIMYAKAVVVTGATVTGVQWGVFNTTGQLNWGKKQFTLSAGERIVLSGNSSITTTGVVSIYGTQVAAPYWGDYAI